MDELKDRLQNWRDRYVSAANEAKRANLEAGSVKKDAHDSIFTQVENVGGKPRLKAFKAAMTTLDHADKARGKREDVVAGDDADVQHAFDHLMIMFDPQLKLFDEETADRIEVSAANWPPEDNVVKMESAA